MPWTTIGEWVKIHDIHKLLWDDAECSKAMTMKRLRAGLIVNPFVQIHKYYNPFIFQSFFFILFFVAPFFFHITFFAFVKMFYCHWICMYNIHVAWDNFFGAYIISMLASVTFSSCSFPMRIGFIGGKYLDCVVWSAPRLIYPSLSCECVFVCVCLPLKR